MNSYIEHTPKGTTAQISANAAENLSRYRPRGCPFKDYTLLDLLSDFIKMYAWKIYCEGKKSIEDFIRLLQAENIIHAVVYGDSIIKLIEET